MTLLLATATCSDTFLERCRSLLRPRQRPPGAGCRISVRKPCITASTGSDIHSQLILAMEEKPKKNQQTGRHLNQASQKERASSSISRVLAPPLAVETSPVPGPDQLPPFWAAEFSRAAPAPHVLPANEPWGESFSPPAARQPGQYLPARGHRMLSPAQHHHQHSSSGAAQPSTAELGRPHKHRGLKFTPEDVLEPKGITPRASWPICCVRSLVAHLR